MGFFDFIENELLPAIDFEADRFWTGLAELIDDLSPVNRKLLQARDLLQQRIDDWHGSAGTTPIDHDEYVNFLTSIGYLVEPGASFTIGTENVDPEIATVAGPQLVVPVSNARFALNAANVSARKLACAWSDFESSTATKVTPRSLTPTRTSCFFDRRRAERTCMNGRTCSTTASSAYSSAIAAETRARARRI